MEELFPQKFGRRGKIWVGILLAFCMVGLVAYSKQLSKGLVVTSMRDYASWGVYISGFVFFVALSMVGSLITVGLRFVKAPWSKSVTRIAEIISVSTIICASLIIVVDMGRPERFLSIFSHGRLQSPIIWDAIDIVTYLFINIFLLYFLLLPDFHILLSRREKTGKFQNLLYKYLGSFWKNTPEQIKLNNKAINLLSIVIVPFAFAIPTSWLFATTYRPGWDSTNFGAYFISGAFLAGAGSILIAMYVLRKHFKLEKYFSEDRFDKMSKIVIVLALLYLYFNINEFLVPAYKMKKADEGYLLGLFVGEFAPIFWFAVFTSIVFPLVVLMSRKGRKPFPAFIVGIVVVIGSWVKRYIIVTPTLLHPFLPMHDVPESYRHYFPSWEEWAISLGFIAVALLIITLLIRLFPVIPIQETITEIDKHHDKEV